MAILSKIRRTVVKENDNIILSKKLLKEVDERYYDIETHTLKLSNFSIYVIFI